MLPYTNRVRNRDNRESLELERSCTYDLLSVIVHVGEIETGHYVSYCRVSDQVSLNSQFLRFVSNHCELTRPIYLVVQIQ